MNAFLNWIPRRSELSPRVLGAARIGVPIFGAALYLLLWTIAEAGRAPFGLKWLMFLAWALTISVTGIWPRAALLLTVAIPAAIALASFPLAAALSFRLEDRHGELIDSFKALDFELSLSTSWPAWLVVPLIVGFVAATAPRKATRMAALVTGVVSAAGYALILVSAGWASWIGRGNQSYVWHVNVELAFRVGLSLVASVLAAWLIGIGLAALWRVQVVTGVLEHTAAQLDDADLELRLAHDRGRISRDIHDSLAHSLAIIVAQAEGAAAIHGLKPEAAPESLGNIATVARHALGEVRRLVERITDDADVSEHTSRLEHVPGLIDEVRAVGVDASLRTLGDPAPLALSKQVAVFRIVQESLTNALKHGGRGTAVTVTLDAQGAGLAVLVVSKTGGGVPLVQGSGRGIGIAGMRERARLVGGWLTAVPSDDETFVVTAFIPPDVDVEIAGAGRPDAAGEASAAPCDDEAEAGLLAIEGARG